MGLSTANSSVQYFADASDFMPFNDPDTIVDAVLGVVARARARYGGADIFGFSDDDRKRSVADTNALRAVESECRGESDETLCATAWGRYLHALRVRDAAKMAQRYADKVSASLNGKR